ncbi:MAG: alpha/beta fold hydrolase [Chloroflexi bacterium]|nr:alpha/beta fold hydrolase [Chloroflexota bacterium]
MPHTYTNGIVTFYEDASPAGVTDAQAVVLIHGHSVDLRMWQHQVPPLLDAGFRVVRYDVRGHGRSMAPPQGYTWEHYAADLGDLLDRINVERPASESLSIDAAHLVGSSMGGGIALQFALDFPRCVLSLTLVDAGLPGFTYSEEFAGRVEELVQAVRSEGPRAAFERLWLTHPLFDGLRRYPERFALVREMVLAFPAADYREGAIPAGYAPTVADRLGEIMAPALVVAGEKDIPDFRLIAEVLAANLPNARPRTMPGCGHVPPLEQPREFNAALIGFLREVPHISRSP